MQRTVTLTRLGLGQDSLSEYATITIPYNGDEFEFLASEWRALARNAACTPSGVLREGSMIATIKEVSL